MYMIESIYFQTTKTNKWIIDKPWVQTHTHVMEDTTDLRKVAMFCVPWMASEPGTIMVALGEKKAFWIREDSP